MKEKEIDVSQLANNLANFLKQHDLLGISITKEEIESALKVFEKNKRDEKMNQVMKNVVERNYEGLKRLED